MRYVGLSFTMNESEIYVIQGTASTFTYVNLGTQAITVHGSNDNRVWDDVVRVAPQDSEVRGHSFKFLKCTGVGCLSVSRGVGGIGSPPSEGGGNNKIEVQDLDLNSYAEKIPSLMKLTLDIPQTLLGTNVNGLLKGKEQPKPPLNYDTYDFSQAENMSQAANAKFIPDSNANPMTNCWAVINPLQEYREYEIVFGNQPQTDIVIRSPDGSQQITIKHMKRPNGTYGLDIVNISGQIFPLGDSVSPNKPINSIVIKFQNNLLYILRVADVVLTTNFDYPYDHVMEFKIWGDLYDPVNMTADQFIQIGWALTGLGSRAALLSGFFKINIGEFTVTLDDTRPSCLFVLRDQEPTQSYMVNPALTTDLIIAVMYMMGSINVIITDDLNGQPKFTKTIENSVGLEAVTFKIPSANTIEVFNKGVSVGSYVHNTDIPDYVQTANFPMGILFNELAFNLEKAFDSLTYRVPLHIKDGVYYKLNSDAILFDKVLKKGDFIQFYDNKSNIIVTRLNDTPELPEIPKSIEYYRGRYYGYSELVERVSNPKLGDYAILTENNKSNLSFYSPEENGWKPLLSETNFRGVYSYSPWFPDSKAGDYILLGYYDSFKFAFYHPYLHTYVEVKPKNSDEIQEGLTNMYYTDLKVISLLESMFLTDFAPYPSVNGYFTSYLKRLLASNSMPVKTTMNIYRKAVPENLDFKLDGVTKITSQITYESKSDGSLSPTESTPDGAYDIFEFNVLPFDVAFGFWYVNFEVFDLTNSDAELQVGVMVNGGADLPQQYQQDIFWIRFVAENNGTPYKTFWWNFNAPNGLPENRGNQRFSFGFKNGYIYLIQADGRWSLPFGNVVSNPAEQQNIKFFIRKIHGHGIAVRNVQAVFGEVFELPINT